MYFFCFSSFIDTLFLLCDSKPCTYDIIYIYIYDEVVIIVLSPIFTSVVSFLFLCTCFLLFVCSLLFLFHTKMLWWVFLKEFQKYRLWKSLLPWTLFLQNFSRVCVRIDFIVFNKWIWVEWFMSSLICSFVCCGFVTDCQRGRLLGHMWFTCQEHMSLFYVIG